MPLVSSRRRSASLGVVAGEKVLFVRRLRLAARRPIFVCASHLPVTRFPMLKDGDYEAISLSRLFEERIGRKIVAFVSRPRLIL